jgi:hypothetical protein
MQSQPAIRSIERRSYRGDPEALRALLYNVADGLWAAALGASEQEADAAGLAEAAWRRWLENLGRWRFRADLVGWLRLALWDEISLRADPPLAELALALWDGEGGVGAAPAALVEHLEQDLESALPAVQRRARARRKLVWATFLLACALLGALVTGAVEMTLRVATLQAQQVAWSCLQSDVRTRHLDWAVQDLLFDLDDPQGTDRAQAQTLSQAVLILEEIAESGARPGRQSLVYIRQRLEAGNLVGQVEDLAADAPPASAPLLAQTALVLEEVGTL